MGSTSGRLALLAALVASPVAHAAPPPSGAKLDAPSIASAISLELTGPSGAEWASVVFPRDGGRIDVLQGGNYRVSLLLEQDAPTAAPGVDVVIAGQKQRTTLPPADLERCQPLVDGRGLPYGRFCIGLGTFRLLDTSGKVRVLVTVARAAGGQPFPGVEEWNAMTRASKTGRPIAIDWRARTTWELTAIEPDGSMPRAVALLDP